MSLDFFAHSRSPEADWNRCDLSWYSYNFDTGVVSCIEASAEPGWKFQNDCDVLADGKVPEVLVIFLEDEKTSQSEAKWHRRPIFSTQYPAYLGESLVAASEEMASTDVAAGDMDGEAD